MKLLLDAETPAVCIVGKTWALHVTEVFQVTLDENVRMISDTVAFLKVQTVNMTMHRDENGRMTMSSRINPMQVIDDWAVLPDGRIAIVRGRDYHIDWVGTDGSTMAQSKLAFAWRRLDDSSKAAFLDSTRIAMERIRERQQASVRNGGVGGPTFGGAPEGAGGGGAPMIVMRIDGGGPPGGGDGPRPTGAAPNWTIPPITMVEPSELPDYAPAFSAGAVRADADGNLWIRTSLVVNGGSVYDIVNGTGALVDRVQVPAGRVIAGFGPGGVVYMGVREGAATRLERARRP